MIRINRYIRINILTVFMFAFGFVFRYPTLFYITYAIMIMHETAHLVAARCIGLRVDYIVLQPFGANLRLKNRLTSSIADEIILYISGPLVNAAAAVAAAVIYKYTGSEIFRLTYISNIVLFGVNLLPAMPLDGGMIARRLLTYVFGYRAAGRICTAISFVICALITAAGIYAVIISRNFTVLMFAALILGNIFTRNDEYYAAMDSAWKIMNNNITV